MNTEYTLKERIEKVDALLTFYVENGRLPKTNSTNVKEKSLAHLLNKMNMSPHHFKDEIKRMNEEYTRLIREFNII